MTARPGLAFASLFFTAGAILLLFFVILAGVKNSNPLNQIYFLQAHTANIPGAPPESRWTLWHVCGVNSHGRNTNCGKVHPAYPFDPKKNFHTRTNVPHALLGDGYYLMSRFMFAFFLITLFFAVCSLFTGLLAIFSRLGGALSGLLGAIALFFETITASLMTACFVLGRDKFRKNGQSAKLGVKAFAFTWTVFACLFLSTVLFCLTAAVGRKDTTYTKRTTATTGRTFFRRKRSTRSRGSFIDNESQKRVKDEYS